VRVVRLLAQDGDVRGGVCLGALLGLGRCALQLLVRLLLLGVRLLQLRTPNQSREIR
jgi:hypothetical protein